MSRLTMQSQDPHFKWGFVFAPPGHLARRPLKEVGVNPINAWLPLKEALYYLPALSSSS